jgi:hypothetical protein
MITMNNCEAHNCGQGIVVQFIFSAQDQAIFSGVKDRCTPTQLQQLEPLVAAQDEHGIRAWFKEVGAHLGGHLAYAAVIAAGAFMIGK